MIVPMTFVASLQPETGLLTQAIPPQGQ